MAQMAQRVANTTTTIFTEINQLAARYDAINLGQGKPDFDAPQAVLDATVDAMRAGTFNQYAPGFGVAPLREAVAAHAERFYGMRLDPQDNVLITHGATGGLFNAIMGAVNPGEEVILLEPFFDVYLAHLEFAGAKPVFVPMRPPEWTFDEAQLRAAFNENTAAILINTPHNPSGRVFSRAELQIIAELCQQYDAIAISDEVYEHLTYDGFTHTPIATLPDMFERTITVSSAAKTFSVTGWKIGWMLASTEFIAGGWRIQQNVTFTEHHPSQYGVAFALGQDLDYYEELNEAYTRRRDILLNGLNAAGLPVTYVPQGAFYVLADYRDVFEGDDRAFARYLIETVGVASIPPSSFFSAAHREIGQGVVRFSYCMQDETLHRAMDRLQALKKG